LVNASIEDNAHKFVKSIRVLLVDDKPSQMDLMKLNLEQSDPSLSIILAPTPVDALKLLSDHPIDCIVSDYIMPGMNGTELCTEVKKTMNIPFIIYTARGSEEVASAAFAAGVDDYVMKEPNLAHYVVLAKRIRHSVEKCRAEAVIAAANKELAKTNVGLKESNTELTMAREVVQEHANKLEGMVENGRAKLRDSEERLRRLEQMNTISRIGATVAHDLRGPLMSITQATEMARAKQELSDKMLVLIADNAKRSLQMIEELREGTRELKVAKSKVDLSSLVKSSVEGVGKPENIKLDLHLDNGLKEASVDPDLIHRVLENLVRNGVEAMPNGGRLTVSARSDGEEVVVEVGDSGVGIKEEDFPHVFEPMFTTKKSGYGLGLYFVRMALDAHGGHVSFKSKPGGGTTFTVRLPIS
jgi:signal transduction histidine kinase